MSGILWNVISFIIALAILIAVHEFGHFWVARRMGIKVERFSIGFGKALWRRTDRHGCEFVIALIPLGGYIKMLDERAAPVASELRQFAFNNKTIGQRAAVIAAGPIANFVLAIVFFWVIMMHGVPGVRPVVAEVTPDSIAAQADISSGMEFTAIDGVKTSDWSAVRLALMGKIGSNSVQVSITPFNKNSSISQAELQKTLNLRNWQFNPNSEDPLTSLGIQPVQAKIEPVLTSVFADSAASQAGLQPGDRIVQLNKQPITSWTQFSRLVAENPGKTLLLGVMREGSLLSLSLIPATKAVNGTIRGVAGVEGKIVPLAEEYRTLRQYGPFGAVPQAVGESWRLMKLTATMLGKLIVGDVKLSNLSGPISIAEGAGVSASYGLIAYLTFLALISVNLGIINLFPLPVLDGGHLLFLLLEKLKGAPVSERFQQVSYYIGSVVLMMLMGIAIFNDFSRW